MAVLTPKEFEKFWKKVQEDLKHPVGPVPTPKLEEARKKLLKKLDFFKDPEELNVKEEDLNPFYKKILENTKDMDPEIAQVVDKHFWELI